MRSIILDGSTCYKRYFKFDKLMKIGQKVFFMFKDSVRTASISTIRTEENKHGFSIEIEIDKNPAGNQYTCWFSENEIFASKEELFKSL